MNHYHSPCNKGNQNPQRSKTLKHCVFDERSHEAPWSPLWAQQPWMIKKEWLKGTAFFWGGGGAEGITNKKSRHWFCSSNNQLTNLFKWPKLYDLFPILQPILLTKTSEYFLEEFIFFSVGLSICKAWVSSSLSVKTYRCREGVKLQCGGVLSHASCPAPTPSIPTHTCTHARTHTSTLSLKSY